ncbi:MAG: glycosyltransferase family 4 protein [Verrucomicrobium sp.]
MRLLIVDPNFSVSSPSMKGVLRSLPWFRQMGIQTEVWCWYCDENLPVDKVVKLPRLGRLHPLGGYAFSFWARRRARKLFNSGREPRPDLVYTIAWYLPDCDVCHVHFSPFDWERRQRTLGIRSLRDLADRVINLLGIVSARRFLRQTTARLILTVSHAVAGDLAEEEADVPVRVLPNSYDAVRFRPEVRARYRESRRQTLGFADHDHVFVFASAGHYRRKGFFLAVEALALLRKEHQGVKFLVLGGRENRLQELQQQLDAQFSDWKGWITFTGMVSDMEQYLAAGDALLFPSYSEAFALVEVEAAACGLPLFLTRHHGSEMIMEDGLNGRYVEFDPADAARVLGEFVTGAWKPGGVYLKDAIDSETYARRLADELLMTAAAKPSPSYDD